jgi:hypothetical protein
MAIANSPSGATQPSQIQLHDIHVPEQVSNFPIAPGWWILLVLIIISTLWSYQKYRKNSRLNANKKQALTVLVNNPSLSAKECIALLKWTAMQYFNRQKLAKLYGDNFQTFLTEQLPEKYQEGFTEMSQAGFKGQYQSHNGSSEEIDNQCYQATKLWLTYALPVKVRSTKAQSIKASSVKNTKGLNL